MSIELVYVTFPTNASATKCTTVLLKKKLIACANSYSTTSTYRWKGKLIRTKEIVSILKTRKGNYTKIVRELTAMHPYEVPCIIKLPAQANTTYAMWVKKETR